jgi:hypothetical protein
MVRLKEISMNDAEEMCQIIEELCGEIRKNNGVKPDWMLRIDDSFRSPPGSNENSLPD